jgi:hypothetical protein
MFSNATHLLSGSTMIATTAADACLTPTIQVPDKASQLNSNSIGWNTPGSPHPHHYCCNEELLPLHERFSFEPSDRLFIPSFDDDDDTMMNMSRNATALSSSLDYHHHHHHHSHHHEGEEHLPVLHLRARSGLMSRVQQQQHQHQLPLMSSPRTMGRGAAAAAAAGHDDDKDDDDHYHNAMDSLSFGLHHHLFLS